MRFASTRSKEIIANEKAYYMLALFSLTLRLSTLLRVNL